MVKSDLRVLIIDDEPRARSFIRKLLLADPSVEIAGECANGYEAIRAIKAGRPDLIFLDVQMFAAVAPCGNWEDLTMNERSFIFQPHVPTPARTHPRSPRPNPRCSPGLFRPAWLSPDQYA